MRPACTRAFCAPRVRIARIRVLRCSADRAHSDHLAARPLGAIHQQPPSGWQLVHVAMCKIMYHEWAYGPAELTWPELRVPHTAAEAIALLGDGHALLRSDLLGFSEADLDVPRRTNWVQSWPAWRIFTVMTESRRHARRRGRSYARSLPLDPQGCAGSALSARTVTGTRSDCHRDRPPRTSARPSCGGGAALAARCRSRGGAHIGHRGLLRRTRCESRAHAHEAARATGPRSVTGRIDLASDAPARRPGGVSKSQAPAPRPAREASGLRRQDSSDPSAHPNSARARAVAFPFRPGPPVARATFPCSSKSTAISSSNIVMP